jgi:Ser/Thr protein kinase RdoA (MazF antagonist)
MGRFYHGPAGWENHRVPRAEGAELITDGFDETRLRTQLEASYGIRVTGLAELDVGVFRVGRPDGPDWVARVFSPERPAAAVAGDAGILRFLAEHEFPAERLAAPESVSQAGGAWHHLAEGHPREEIAAALRVLDHATDGLTGGDRRSAGAFRKEIEDFDSGDGLPQALIHPDFVLANVVASAERGLVLVDWTGTGRGPRMWSLAFSLYAAGALGLSRVDRLVAGYLGHVRPEPEELARLAGLIRVRPAMFEVWALGQGRKSLAEVRQGVADTRDLADAVAARARDAFATATGRADHG